MFANAVNKWIVNFSTFMITGHKKMDVMDEKIGVRESEMWDGHKNNATINLSINLSPPPMDHNGSAAIAGASVYQQVGYLITMGQHKMGVMDDGNFQREKTIVGASVYQHMGYLITSMGQQKMDVMDDENFQCQWEKAITGASVY